MLDEKWWAQILGGDTGELHSAASSEQYVLLPRASDPRVVVDSSDSQALRDAVARFVSNRGGSAIAPLVGGASAVLSRRRTSWGVTSSDVTLRERLSDVLGFEVRLSIAIGPERPNRKPVIRCYRDSVLVAVAKMGPEAHTARMVRNEGGWLSKLEEEPLEGVVTPRVLHSGLFGGHELLVMEPLDLVGASRQLPVAEVPVEVLRAIGRRFNDDQSVSGGMWWSSLCSRLATPETQKYNEIADQLSNDEIFLELDASAWHGDWSPWNMGELTDGRFGIWDWERAALHAPLGMDLVHLHHQYGDGHDSAVLALELLGVPAPFHNVLTTCYLLELTARHAEGGALQTARQERVIELLRDLRPEFLD